MYVYITFFLDLELQEYSFASFSLTKPERILCCFPVDFFESSLFFHLLTNCICKVVLVLRLRLSLWTLWVFMTSEEKRFSSEREAVSHPNQLVNFQVRILQLQLRMLCSALYSYKDNW